MEAVSAHALGVEPLRYGIVVDNRVVIAVERGIEAGDLRQVGIAAKNGADRREVVRLVQRRERLIAFEVTEHRAIDQDRPVVFRAAMHDAMTDRDRLEFLRLAQPSRAGLQRRRDIC